MNDVNLIYFSPTGTTKKIVTEMAKAYSSASPGVIDLTNRAEPQTVKGTVLIGAPVYVGRLPGVFPERLNQINLENTDCLLAVVYGNREYEDALLELKDLVEQKGGTILGAAAFIGEHSLSSGKTPIARGRPDAEDLAAARQFGRAIRERKGHASGKIAVPGNYPYREVPPKPEVIIQTDKGKCTLCYSCIALCPVAAIPQENPLKTDGTKCLRCCACIKACPEEAREVVDPTSLKIRNMLFEKCQVRKEPEIFL